MWFINKWEQTIWQIVIEKKKSWCQFFMHRFYYWQWICQSSRSTATWTMLSGRQLVFRDGLNYWTELFLWAKLWSKCSNQVYKTDHPHNRPQGLQILQAYLVLAWLSPCSTRTTRRTEFVFRFARTSLPFSHSLSHAGTLKQNIRSTNRAWKLQIFKAFIAKKVKNVYPHLYLLIATRHCKSKLKSQCGQKAGG